MTTPPLVRLLIADSSENRANEIDSILRNAGIPTRPEYCADLSQAIESAPDHFDLMFCSAGFDNLDQLLPQLRERQPELAIIVVDPSADAAQLTRGMALGATDVVFEDDAERLLYVVQRELHHVCQRTHFSQTRKALRESEQRCELLLASATAAIAYVHEGMHIYANDDYIRIFGCDSADDVLGVPLLDLIDPSFADEFKAHMKAYASEANQTSFAFKGCMVSGEPVTGQMTLSPAEYDGEHCTQVLLKCRRETDLATLTEQEPEPPMLTTRADERAVEAHNGHVVTRYNDSASFIDQVELAHSAPDASSTGSMLVVEIDDFDSLQVEHGLDATEHVVEEVAVSLRAEIGSSVMSRIANHRFAIAAMGSEAGGDIMAETLREAVEGALFEIEGKTVRRTITIGAAAVDDLGKLKDALNLAFRTLISARTAGKNNSVHWPSVKALAADEDEGNLSAEQRRILRLVNDAIENDSFVLLFQPIISLRGDADEHYEVFLRLADEKGRRLPPDQFLNLAIENGVAGKIDRWVILQSIKLLSVHRSKGHNTRLTINLTSNSLTDPEFTHWLAVAIKAARLPSDAVIFQIAEPDAAAHVRQAREFVQGLKSMHCRSSLRHFGTTENPFETLRHIAVEFVKLDGGHVLDLDNDTERRDALTKMIKQLQSQGKLTVIPMVESATVLSALWQAGANYIQGHYLQEPSTEMNYDFTADD
ncbi:MAG: EAL domain-containing protein [Gammaproteobacteria bacterium]|nr:EAL domain-containing protein [Gammaproteobacteria bacterium]